MDLVEGKKDTKKCLLIMSERLSRKGLALIIPSKEKQEIVKALRKPQVLNKFPQIMDQSSEHGKNLANLW